jgi:transposase InsO family protein
VASPPKKKSTGTQHPILSTGYRERFQIDLVDMLPKFGLSKTKLKVMMRYVLHVKDHFTKCSFLAPIPNKEPEVVAETLAEVFGKVGYPIVLQSDNGTEFTHVSFLNMLRDRFPNACTVNGRAGVPKTQGSVESGNNLLKKVCRTVKQTFVDQRHPESNNWTYWLPLVNTQMNDMNQKGFTDTPYKAVHRIDYHIVNSKVHTFETLRREKLRLLLHSL